MVNIIQSYVDADVFACDSAARHILWKELNAQGPCHRMFSEVILNMTVDNFDLFVL